MNKKIIINALFLMICFTLVISFVKSTEVPTTIFLNANPNVTSVSLIDGDGGNLQVNALDTAVFNCTGTITDGDSYSDISVVNASFFGYGYDHFSADITGGKYTNSSCLLYGGSGNSTSFTCTVVVHHHTINGTWGCNVTANDSYSMTGWNNATNTVDIFKSVGVPTSTINFGSFALGTDSGTTDRTLLINNTGNRPINVTLDAYPISGSPSNVSSMACTIGSLPVSTIRYSLVASTAATSKISLTDSPLTAPVNLTQTALGATLYTSTSLYFGVVIPNSGQAGICTGFLDVSVI